MPEVFPLGPDPDSMNGPMSPEQLHIEKNAPNLLPPGFRFPRYVPVYFPTAVYKLDANDQIESQQAKHQAELDDYLDRGWAQSPAADELKAAGLRRIERLASAELHRIAEDRHMSPAAHAEVDREQNSREEFLTEMPAGKLDKRGPGRPKKTDPLT